MKSTILFIFLSITISCKQQDQKQITRIDENNSSIAKYSEFFKSARLVKLETNTKGFIADIGKIVVDGDRIFCYDPWKETLTVFDSDGRFISRVGTRGRGPGELTSITDFLIDKKNKQIELLVGSMKKSFVFDYNGNYLYTHTAFYAPGFAKLNDKTYVAYSYNQLIGDTVKSLDADLALFTTSGKFIKAFKDIRTIPREYSRVSFTNLFKSSDGNVYLIPIYEYSLLKIEADQKLTKVTGFQFNRNPPLSLFENNNKKEALQKLTDKGYPYHLSNLLIDPNYIYFNYVIGKVYQNQVFWNRKTNQARSVKKGRWTNDITQLPESVFRGTFDEGLIQIVEPVDFLKVFPKGKEIPSDIRDPELRKQIEFISNTTEPDDNPILVFYTYKL